jgi:cobalt-zinc-cadmium efflux system outer membrane protein
VYGRSIGERGNAERRAQLALGELQLVTGAPPSEVLVLQGDLPTTVDEPPPLPVLLAEALRNRGDLKMAEAALEAARSEAELAAREGLPKPRLGASFAHEEGADIIQGQLGVDVPVFNRNQAARGVAASQVVAAEQTLATLRRRVEQEVRLAHLSLLTSRRAAAAYADEVVTAMRDNLDLSNRAYQAGQIDFTQLLLIRRDSLAAQRDYLETLAELNAAHAQLKRATGAE